MGELFFMRNTKVPGFKLKTKNCDFCVNEIFFEPEQSAPEKSSFTYLLVEKEGLSTFSLLERLARIVEIPVKEVSASGLKDEQAKTRQIISVRKIISDKQAEQINKKLQQQNGKIKVCNFIGYGKKSVLPRMVHGNEFKITIRNLEYKIAKKLVNLIDKNRFQNFINYYDEQRFGTPTSVHNTHLIGKNLLERNWQKAFEEYIKSENEKKETEKVKFILEETKSYREAVSQIMERKRDFFISSHNSYLWNQEVNKTINRLENSIEIEFPYIGKLSFVTKRNVDIPSFLTTCGYEFDWENNRKIAKYKTRPVNVVTAVFLIKNSKDRIFEGKRALTVSFVLLTGCYATMFIKQLLLKVVN